MTEYIDVRASEILGQGELIAFLKSRFGRRVRSVGRQIAGGETIDVLVQLNSPEFQEVRAFVRAKRALHVEDYSKLPIGWYVRKYKKQELKEAEILKLKIHSHFEPCGEECGTIYETLCIYCNWGRQISPLVLDVRRIPQHKDLHETIARTEWIVSSKFVQLFTTNRLTGAEFRPVLDFRDPRKKTNEWHQLKIAATIGHLAEATQTRVDPFCDATASWRCPLGHTFAAQFASEAFFHRGAWDGSDISVTADLFGYGQHLVRPQPLIIISQRLFRLMDDAGLKGFSCEVVHLI